MSAPSWRVVVASGSELGERPIWDPSTKTLLWVETLGGGVHRSCPGEGSDDHWSDTLTTLGQVVGAVTLRDGGGMVAAVDSSIRLLDESGRDDRDPIDLVLPSGHRFNDGACDPAGRFLIGTAGSTPDGVLWSVDQWGRASVVLQDITESNGLGWSGDGQVMYFIDSGEHVIRRYVYDPGTGSVGPRLPDLADVTGRPGAPDGLVVDALGHVWVPQWQGAELTCFDEAGTVVTRWTLPVSQPTCAGFAGAAFTTLVLATSWEGMTSAERSAEPWAGHLLAADVRVPGRQSYAYASLT